MAIVTFLPILQIDLLPDKELFERVSYSLGNDILGIREISHLTEVLEYIWTKTVFPLSPI